MRRAKKVDANQKRVVEALRGAGVEVEVISDLGRGVPDLLCAIPRQGFAGLRLVEVKNKDGKGTKLTPPEALFAARFPVLLVYSAQDAVSQVLGRKTK